jgi:gas vesicle protein
MAGNDGGSGFGALLLGVGVGLAVGFLCAPESREETRKIIASRAKEAIATAAEAIDERKLHIELGLAHAGEGVQTLRARAGDTIAEARKKLHEAARGAGCLPNGASRMPSRA